ncbi:hypothetical protein GGR52DRAFT_140121 [Hypoxylon sp. FL1284]|nr:hypothetical protein GGR52DRAFT_140121 [Hypoxylon sp. FL1284]
MLLREHGVDPPAVGFVQDLEGAMLGKLFRGGMGDFFLVDNVSARVMAAADPGVEVLVEMATDGGNIPWSVYYREVATVTPAVIDAQERFCKALRKGMDWVLQHDAESFRDELAEIFPGVPVDILVDLTNVYRRDGMWTSPLVSRQGFDMWQVGIVDGHLVTEPLVYESIVNTGPAMAAKE